MRIADWEKLRGSIQTLVSGYGSVVPLLAHSKVFIWGKYDVDVQVKNNKEKKN